MTRNILFLLLLATLATPLSLTGEPTPSADRPSRKNAKKAETEKPPPKTDAGPKIGLGEGWNYVKGEWIHSDGFKYVKGQMFRIGAQTHKSPPKPPSRALLDSVSVKAKPTPTPDPNSAAAKAAERERNLRQRPASQTGTHL